MSTTAPERHAGRTALEIAAAARVAQLAIRAQLIRDVTRVWPLLDAKRLDETFPGWLTAMSTLIRSYHGQSAVAAGTAYRAARQRATGELAPSGLIQLAPLPSEEWLNKAFRFSGPGQFSRDVARPKTALSTTLGTASRIALDGARTTIIETVHEDPAAVGWMRVTDGNPCAFCALLASRGVIKGSTTYRTEESASFQAHNDCGCTAAPAFTIHADLPDVSKKAAEVYANRGSGDALKAFRKAWNDHLASSA